MSLKKANKTNKEVKSSSRLAKSKPLLAEAVLRVGGRLEEAVALSYDEKHPIILPKKHHLSRLTVTKVWPMLVESKPWHRRGKMFWILGGKDLKKNIIRNRFSAVSPAQRG